jgi:hypothetical protein
VIFPTPKRLAYGRARGQGHAWDQDRERRGAGKGGNAGMAIATPAYRQVRSTSGGAPALREGMSTP